MATQTVYKLELDNQAAIVALLDQQPDHMENWHQDWARHTIWHKATQTIYIKEHDLMLMRVKYPNRMRWYKSTVVQEISN